MAELPSFLIRRRHSEFDLPWYPDNDRGEVPGTGSAVIADWRLYHYLDDVGIHAYYSTNQRATVFRRQNRFLWVCGILAVAWVVFYFV